MDVSSLDIKISQELVPYICTIKDGETVADKANLSLILGLIASQVITLEKAAELAGKSVWDFIEILKSYHIPWGEYTEDEMQMDEITLGKKQGAIECVKTDIDRLRNKGYRISQTLYLQILERSGELD